MKIALACDWFLPRLGGIETHLHDLAVRLRARGHDVQVITPTPGDARVDDVPVHRVPALLFPGFHFACNPQAFAGMAEVLRNERFDVVHAHASIVSPAAYAAAFSGLRTRTPTLVSFHSVVRNHAWWLTPLVRSLNLPGRGARFAAVSGIVAREAASLLSCPDVTVLPNAVDESLWKVTHVGNDARAPLLVSTMRLQQKKRPLALIRILARARDISPPFRALIIGDGPERAAVEKLIQRLGLGDIVRLTGRLTREGIAEIYSRAHAFVLPTVLESFGISVLEARAAGLPVIIRREAGVAELLSDGEDGLIVGSDEAMAAAIQRLVSDTLLRRHIAAHNESAPPPATWNAVIEQHERLYMGLAGA